MQALAAQRDTAALERISYWDAGAPGYRWNEIAIAQAAPFAPIRISRADAERSLSWNTVSA